MSPIQPRLGPAVVLARLLCRIAMGVVAVLPSVAVEAESPPPETPVHHELPSSQAVSGSWSPSRMQAAAGTGPQARWSFTPGLADRRPPDPEWVDRTIGRLFFRHPVHGDGSCSGTVVNSQGRNMVLTAGHCVHRDRRWVTAVIFVPGYDDGQAPFGKWVAGDLWSFEGWTAGGKRQSGCGGTFYGGDSRYDLGVVLLDQLDGSELVDVVGGNGIALDPSPGEEMEAYGHPSAAGGPCTRSVGGSGLWCGDTSATVSENDDAHPGILGVRCLSHAGDGTGLFGTRDGSDRYLMGVVSHRVSNVTNRLQTFTADFGDDSVRRLYQQASLG